MAKTRFCPIYTRPDNILKKAQLAINNYQISPRWTKSDYVKVPKFESRTETLRSESHIGKKKFLPFKHYIAARLETASLINQNLYFSLNRLSFCCDKNFNRLIHV